MPQDPFEMIQEADTLFARTNHKEALDLLNRAEQKASKNDKNDELAILYSRIGRIYRNHGYYEKAKSHFQESVEIFEQLASIDSVYNLSLAMTRNVLGTLLRDMGKFGDAKINQEEALRISEELLKNDPDNVQFQSVTAGTLTNLSTLLSDMGRLDEAKIKFDEELKIYDSLLKADSDNVNYQSHVAKIHNNLGIILRKEGSFPEALRCHSKALDISSKSGTPDLIFRILYFRGLCHETMGSLDNAYKDYSESIEQIELIRSQFSLEEYKLDILGGKERVYPNMISLCVKKNDICRAWEYVGRAKSRTLLDYLRLIELPVPERML